MASGGELACHFVCDDCAEAEACRGGAGLPGFASSSARTCLRAMLLISSIGPGCSSAQMGRPSSTPATSAEKCNTFPVSAWISTSGAPNPSLRRMARVTCWISSRTRTAVRRAAGLSARIRAQTSAARRRTRCSMRARISAAASESPPSEKRLASAETLFDLEHVRPDFRYESLEPVSRDWPPVAPSGFCQFPPVELPGRAHREIGNDLDDRRNHVRR